MQARDVVGGLLRELGAELGIELTLDAEGICILECSDGEECVILVPEDHEFMVLQMPLTPLFPSDDRAFLEQVLRLNLELDETHGALLGMAPMQRVLVCRYLQPLAGLDFRAFARVLTEFKDTADRLNQRLAELRQGRVGSGDGRPAAGGEPMLHIAG